MLRITGPDLNRICHSSRNHCANSLDGKPWVTLHIDDAGDTLWPILHPKRHFWGKGGLRLGVAVPTDFSVRSMKGDLEGTVRPIKPWVA